MLLSGVAAGKARKRETRDNFLWRKLHIFLDKICNFFHTYLMKRKHILKKLAAAGLIILEGGNHARVYDKQGHLVSSVPRHAEIKENLALAIEKQTGVKLR
jgi:hypothetical protein